METVCTFVFVLVVLMTLHQNLRNNRSQAISSIAIGASYSGMLALSGFNANGVLNPALAFAMGVCSNWWPNFFPANSYLTANTTVLTMVKSVSPLLGGVLAGLLFIVQRRQLEKKEDTPASNDVLRGSFFIMT